LECGRTSWSHHPANACRETSRSGLPGSSVADACPGCSRNGSRAKIAASNVHANESSLAVRHADHFGSLHSSLLVIPPTVLLTVLNSKYSPCCGFAPRGPTSRNRFGLHIFDRHCNAIVRWCWLIDVFHDCRRSCTDPWKCDARGTQLIDDRTWKRHGLAKLCSR
jgi:hypothetical protein